MSDKRDDDTAKPAWLAPALVLLVIGGLFAVGRKKKGAVENPLVDIAVLTVGVFAFAAVFRVLAVHLGSPGMSAFFGGSPDSTTK